MQKGEQKEMYFSLPIFVDQETWKRMRKDIRAIKWFCIRKKGIRGLRMTTTRIIQIFEAYEAEPEIMHYKFSEKWSSFVEIWWDKNSDFLDTYV